jgi:hypothetical protein
MNSCCQQEYIIQRLKEGHEDAKFRLIVIELDLAIAFCRLAACMEGCKAEQISQNAKCAYNSAMQSLDGATLTPAMRHELQEKLLCVTPLLRRLGSNVSQAA